MIKNCEETAPILKHLAHPQRLFILCLLSEGEKTVADLSKHCDLSQSLLSQFLSKMRSEGLVEYRREGKFSVYRIRDPRIAKLISAMHKIFS